ncbi:MAG: hypothetical protein KKH52_01960, partial [Nanoarchaeota archaeon]|nr:hypothetical protein [Nanoarchaeota archaeon]
IGTHTHIAQAPDDERKLYQIRLLKGVEPLSPALTSTSPIRYDGRNSLNNHRINLHRYNVFSEFPFHAQLQDYPESLGVINERNVQLVEIWQRVAAREGITPTEFLKEFQPHNTGYAPIRKRDYFGPTGTWEVRSADATPLYHLSDNSALIKGINDYAMSRHIPIIVAEQDGFYEFTPNRFVVPNHRTGLAMEQAYIDKGLETHPKYGDLMVDFLRTILPYAEEGLPSEDKPYLAPAWEMANTQMNPSSQLIHELHKKRKFRRHQYTPKMSAHANLIAREMYVAGLNN